MDLKLHHRQGEAFRSGATEILYGGAAGGGKSHLMRVAAIAWCIAVPGLQVYLFRREYPGLRKNHFEGPSSLPAILAEWISAGHVKFNISDLAIKFSNGSAIYGCHCQRESDVYGYLGAEMHVLLIDELTHFSEQIYRVLRSRCRTGSLVIPADCAWKFPRILACTNPGGVGHNWVKSAWVDPRPPMDVERVEDGGMLRQFIPALLADNPSLNAQEYSGLLQGLGRADLVKAMLEGSWDIVAGGMFDDVWHGVVVPTIPAASLPRGWRLSRSFDWGSSKPFAVCWWAEADGTKAANGWCPKKGSWIQFAEWYGWNGEADTGMRMTAADIGRGIIRMEAEMDLAGRVLAGPADSAIFATENGNCIGDDFARTGVRWTPADKGPGSRINGWETMRRLMSAAGKTPQEEAALFVMDSCRQTIRTLPTLPRDERKTEDVDTDSEDHIADAMRYRVNMPTWQAGAARAPGM